MASVVPSYQGFRFPVEIISHCVWLYHRFPLSLREVEEMMMERGIVVTYETIRAWCRTFGQIYANGLRRRRPRPGDKWHLDEVFITIRGKTHYLWRAVDQDGNVLDILVTSRRDAKAATRFFRKLLLDPDEGEVLLDGVALPRLDRRELRRAVCYAFERPVLIGETLADVISFGQHTPDPHEVITAARAARADTFIRGMPAGYQTPLSDAPMSGGEIQRLGLARAFAHAGRVLVLDDVAASLDTVTEHHIRQALTGTLADRTRLIVAHRVSTAAHADLVIWLDNGKVRSIAPHHQLWMQPCYRAVFDPAFSPPNELAEGAPA